MTEDIGNEDPSVNFAFSLHGKYDLPMKVDAVKIMTYMRKTITTKDR